MKIRTTYKNGNFTEVEHGNLSAFEIGCLLSIVQLVHDESCKHEVIINDVILEMKQNKK